MGAVAQAVVQAVEDVGHAVGQAVQEVGHVVEQVAQEVSRTTERVVEAVGQAGRDIDKFVNREIPGGWATVGAVAITVATLGAAGPEAFAAVGAEEGAIEAGAIGVTEAGVEGSGLAGLEAGIETGGAMGGGGALGGSAAGSAIGTVETAAGGSGLAGLGLGGTEAAAAGTPWWQSALVAAGKGALVGGGLGATKAAITGGNILESALKGALIGGATAGLGSSLGSAFTEAGLSSGLSNYLGGSLASGSVGLAQGASPETLLTNMALSGGLGQLGKYVDLQGNLNLDPTIANTLTSAGTGAIGSAIKGGDITMGAISGALSGGLSSLTKQLIDASKAANAVDPTQKILSETDATNIVNNAQHDLLFQSENMSSIKAELATAYENYTAQQDLVNERETYLNQDREYLKQLIADNKMDTEEFQTAKAIYDENLAALKEDLAQNEKYAADYNSAKSAFTEAQTQIQQAVAQNTQYHTNYDTAKANYEKTYEAYKVENDKVVSLQDAARSLYDQVMAQQKIYDDNKAAYESNTSNTTAFNAANAAAANLNTLIPQYNAAYDAFDKADTNLNDIYNKSLTPALDAYKVASNALDASTKATNELYNGNFTAAKTALEQAATLLNKSTESTNAFYASTFKQAEDAVKAAQVEMQNSAEAAKNYYEGTFTPAQQAALEAQQRVKDMLTSMGSLGDKYQAAAVSIDQNAGKLAELAADTVLGVGKAEAAETTPSGTTNAGGATGTGTGPQKVEGFWKNYMTDSGSITVEVYRGPDGKLYETGMISIATLPDGTASGNTYSVDFNAEGEPSGPPPKIETTEGEPAATGEQPDQTAGTSGSTTTTPTKVPTTTPTESPTNTPTEVPTKSDGSIDADILSFADLQNLLNQGKINQNQYNDAVGEKVANQTAAVSGLSGFSGLSGVSGLSGYSGISNVGGLSGYSGISDIGGVSGISGGNGLSGYGDSGYGDSGYGYSGISGVASGYSGVSGVSGVSGFSGISGTSGTSGTGSTSSSGTSSTGTGASTGTGTGTGTGTVTLNTTTAVAPQATASSFPALVANIVHGSSDFDLGGHFGDMKHYATGGSSSTPTALTVDRPQGASTRPALTAKMVQGSPSGLDFNVSFADPKLINTSTAQAPQFVPYHYADGGHVPQFFSEGGLNSLENKYVQGEGDGTSDDVPAMLATGEFVIPADVVSSLGNGSNESGANILDEFLQAIRAHKQNHNPKELPPDSLGPLAYLNKAIKKAGK